MSSRSDHDSADGRPLLSSTSILIISGFLIGTTVGKFVGEDLSPYVLSAGLAGVLAFLMCDLVATRRRERDLVKERRQILGRLERHVLHTQGASQPSAPHANPPDDPPSVRSSTVAAPARM